MGLFNFGKDKKEAVSDVKTLEPKGEILTGYGAVTYGGHQPVIKKIWDGEKTSGELGVIIDNVPDFYRLRLRSLDAYVKTDIVKIIIDRKLQWVIGTGLKFEAEPNKEILKAEGIVLPENFYNLVESRFKTYFGSVNCDYSKEQSLHGIAWDCKMGADVGGDMLVVVRIENGYPNIQLISGEFVCTPLEYMIDPLPNGNYIENGIEFNERGEHVAYHVKKRSKDALIDEFERIVAKGEKTGLRLSWMVYGDKLSPDHKRGVPVISPILEKVNKIDRYTEAAISKAEQAANHVMAIEHADYSTGDNPFQDIIKAKFTKPNADGTETDSFGLSDSVANRLAISVSGTVTNLPPGASLKSFNTDIESNYGEFFEANFKNICASMGVPYEVALQSYNSNYSASRAAINGFGYIVDIDVDDISKQFYKPIYNIFLYTEVLRNKINLEGFLKAMITGDFMLIEAYSGCRFVGKKMPHIDPLKEVKAIRSALGDKSLGEEPLMSLEQATEQLGYGDWRENYEERQEEQEIINKTNVKDATISTIDNTGDPVGSQTEV